MRNGPGHRLYHALPASRVDFAKYIKGFFKSLDGRTGPGVCIAAFGPFPEYGHSGPECPLSGFLVVVTLVRHDAENIDCGMPRR